MIDLLAIQEVKEDPVLCADGHSYERAAITAWFASDNCASPVTGQPLEHRRLLPNHALRIMIQAAAAR